MSNNYTLLSPVSQEEFRLTFGRSQQLAGSINPDEVFKPTIAHFKKLAVGPYFWFIADPLKWIVHSSGGMLEQLMPIKENEFIKHSPEILFRNTHPEDIVHMFAFTNYWVNFFSNLSVERKPYVRATIYLRLLNRENHFNWMMIQYTDTIVDNDGKILYGLTLVTDISHIKKTGMATMSILDTYVDSCQQFFCLDGKSLVESGGALAKLTTREIEVLHYLANGFSSKQIAATLNISIKTIDNHRQNMLRKTNAKSTGELVSYGISMGYV